MKKFEKLIFEKENVVGIGRGRKIRGTVKTETPCYTVMVEKKIPLEKLSRADRVPAMIEGLPSDVIQTGKIKALAARTDKWRPAPGGVSIGHYAITAGTLGARVFDAATNEPLILSNNHVLANSNNAVEGDAILQPGPYDNGKNPDDRIGTLLRFVPISFSENGGGSSCPFAKMVRMTMNFFAWLIDSAWRLREYRIRAADNTVDCAVASPDSPELLVPEILEIGTVAGTREDLVLGELVKKSGRTTGLLSAEVQMVEATVQVDYGGPIATFVNQYVAGYMCSGGDSGSLVLDQNNNAVGLLFAGSDTTTIFNPIAEVLTQLNIKF